MQHGVCDQFALELLELVATIRSLTNKEVSSNKEELEAPI